MNVFEKVESLSSGQKRSCCSLPGLPRHPGEICFAAGSLLSRDEWLSRPSHRPGPGLLPSPTLFCFAADSLLSCRHPRLYFYNAAEDDSMEMPDADSAVPQSPVSGNVPSARGLPLAGPGTGSTPRLGGMSLRISFISSSANLVGSMAAERSYRAFGAPVPNYSVLGGECSLSVLGLMLVPMFFSFLQIVPISLLSGPFVSSRIPCFVPKRRSQRGVVISRA